MVKNEQELEQINIKTLNNGAMEDMFQNELDRVLRNINDLNCKSTAMREIKIVLKITPTEDRQMAQTSLAVTSKLAPIEPHGGSVFLSFRNNKPKAFPNNAQQMTMPNIGE